MPQLSPLRLSICISTLNGADTIGAMLDSVIVQATPECEIVVLDGASTDDTERIVRGYVDRFDHLRYVRQDKNNGVDRDFDRAIYIANGEYCWLASDDDVLKPGAITAVLEATRQDLSLVIVNAEVCDQSLSKILRRRYLDITTNRVYGIGEMDRLFSEVGSYLRYIGCIVIRRTIWLARNRDRYYGSLFIHVGVIFQEHLPAGALVIAQPFIKLRSSHLRWNARFFEILAFKWPSVVWSLCLSDCAKRTATREQGWRSLKLLLACRAVGEFSATEYRRLVRPLHRSIWDTLTPALVTFLPCALANILCELYYSMGSGAERDGWLRAFRSSRYHLSNWRVSMREL